MFRIKICGITSVADGLEAARAGADAIGLNFCPTSPRRIEPGLARQIADPLPPGVARVGVFVNAAAAEVRQIAAAVGLDFVQLHGDESPDYLVELAGLPIIRALRGSDSFRPVAAYLAACRDLGQLPAALLVDAFQAGQYGGTGQTPDWAAIVEARPTWPNLPLILAGGLNPGNVAAAIRRVRPTAVDTASGVESSPGVKSSQRLAEFVVAARSAFASLDALES